MSPQVEQKTDRRGNIPQWFTLIVLGLLGWFAVNKVQSIDMETSEARTELRQAAEAVSASLKDSDAKREDELSAVRNLLDGYESKRDVQFNEQSARIGELERHMSYIEGSLQIKPQPNLVPPNK